MRIAPPLVLLLFMTSHLIAQRLHMPDEISRMMERSTVKYSLDTAEAVIPKAEYPDKGQRSSKLRRVDDGMEIRLEREGNVSDPKVEKSLNKGNKQLSRSKYEKARKCYLYANELRPSDTRISNRIGHTYAEEKDYASAAYWYEQSIAFNSIDTEARLQASRCYKEMGDTAKAVNQILMAHLFNRNDSEIMSEMQGTLSHFGMKYDNHTFEPSYIIYQKDDGVVSVIYGHPVWASYAAVKAMWRFEPEYAEQMNRISSQPAHVIREKEALLNAIVTYDHFKDEDKSVRFPLLDMISDVSLMGQIDHFITYEIIGRQDPEFLLLLTPKEFSGIKEYILKYRNR